MKIKIIFFDYKDTLADMNNNGILFQPEKLKQVCEAFYEKGIQLCILSLTGKTEDVSQEISNKLKNTLFLQRKDIFSVEEMKKINHPYCQTGFTKADIMEAYRQAYNKAHPENPVHKNEIILIDDNKKENLDPAEKEGFQTYGFGLDDLKHGTPRQDDFLKNFYQFVTGERLELTKVNAQSTEQSFVPNILNYKAPVCKL